MSAAEWAGRELGTRTVGYDADDAILYALAVGASADDLDLVFEDRLRVLPTFGLTLAQWAPDVLADAGAFDDRALHGTQTLVVHRPLPAAGELRLAARVGEVWDKGSAAVFEVIVECAEFTATWALFAPGFGGFGGERGPSRAAADAAGEPRRSLLRTFPAQAALYRLTGDKHHIHIDPAASARIGQPKPILQGLCTLAAATLEVARLRDAHPADLVRLEGRFSGAVVPGDVLDVRLWDDGRFQLDHDGRAVLTDARADFA
ncbi:MaoC/PaaZ C-terminal domain-containing protein [Microbacterium sp. zg.Y1090]|uniref:MaoC/PaaZ C-terminal domain-containing protein n=1 Tax=Microbacterium TaxID=33882 RepID=UPI00214BB979|nr:MULTISPECIES: MaoC/PaaZ C-terminal domain-containing protein [unclassified Microbacterium]MCR2813340.1 MaoC/PaaZ C-terminal domain-containing protein [Microbacterium sp. zg.Y1084]MCR2819826.1 MaoC/PaaZ C-terminal domain-containing protein [Microbacterium sp. zg.Y1090]MDL5487937.1 MaoC/PaaZ C-terminal domain-containing protein [Microbacterium sp. zg-Y1211]WIM28617.1 MaoC/PaaZ C-terminal domain-containing protein [Microbacterium sp. zg-Y1090]